MAIEVIAREHRVVGNVLSCGSLSLSLSLSLDGIGVVRTDTRPQMSSSIIDPESERRRSRDGLNLCPFIP